MGHAPRRQKGAGSASEARFDWVLQSLCRPESHTHCPYLHLQAFEDWPTSPTNGGLPAPSCRHRAVSSFPAATIDCFTSCILWGKILGAAFLGGFCSESFMRLQLRYWSGLQSSEGLAKSTESAYSKWLVIQLANSCWSLTVGLSSLPHRSFFLMPWRLASHRARTPRKQGINHDVFLRCSLRSHTLSFLHHSVGCMGKI